MNSNTLELRYVGENDWANPAYRDQYEKLWFDIGQGDSPDLYSSSTNELDGEPCSPIAQAFTIVLAPLKTSEEQKAAYMLLSRLRADCDYFLGYGAGNQNRLWAGSPEKQIEEMKRLWESFTESEKPQWLSWEDILKYERLMTTEEEGLMTPEDERMLTAQKAAEPKFRMPQDKEWDKLLDIVGEDDALTHWATAFFWDNSLENQPRSPYGDCAWRSGYSARLWNLNPSSYVYPLCGFRPVLEVLGTDHLNPGDSLQRYALYLDDVEQLLPADPTDYQQIPQFEPGQRIEFKEATCEKSTITWLHNGECFIAARVLLANIAFDELETQGFAKKQPAPAKIENGKRLLADELIALLSRNDETELERISKVFTSEAFSDDQSPVEVGAQMVEAFLSRDVNAFCVALTGWDFASILKKAEVIPDDDGVFHS